MDTQDICKDCGRTIPYAHETVNVLGMTLESRQDYCEACHYLRYFATHHLVRPPWQWPLPRPMKDGTPPKAVFEQIAQLRAQQNQWVAKHTRFHP